MEPIAQCSKMPVSTKSNFSTMKVRSEFFAWLRRESVRRGIFLYELVEELSSRSMFGKKPWAPTRRSIR